MLPDNTSFRLAPITETHEAQLNKLSSYRFDNLHKLSKKRRLEFFSGRLCAAQCLDEIGAPTLNVKISSDRSPIWPKDYLGSISHSNSFAVSLVSTTPNYSAIGIDLQPLSTYILANELKNTIFHQNELIMFWDNKNSHSRTRNFDIIFSAKEALFKALYPKCKLFFDHHSAEVISIDSQKCELTIKLNINLGTYWKQNQLFNIKFKYINEELLTCLLIS